MNGLFITIEGPDGSGKTSVVKEVSNRLNKYNIKHITTREPGGIDIAEQIRRIILDPLNTAMDAKTEALLYAASRRQHLVEKVIPNLNNGVHVICERFVESSLAYQGYGRQLGIDEVFSINQFAIDGVMPDITIFLDVDPETGLERINRNRKDLDRLDLEKIDFHERVYQGYMIVKEMFKDRIVVVDANKTIEEVIEDVVDVIIKRIG
ncbi:MAG: thymidylate kinase [Haloplasmataceae bacterium]|jgi:dTMP kinase|nr:thymidylate kinase [Haloplasmataceae bacterium]